MEVNELAALIIEIIEKNEKGSINKLNLFIKEIL